MIWKRGDTIFITANDNKYYQQIMICTQVGNKQSVFEAETGIIFLAHTQEALAKVGIKITKETHPEYYL